MKVGRNLLLVSPAPFMMIAPVVALQDAPPNGLSEYQFIIVGFLASVFVWALRQIKVLGYHPDKKLVSGVVYVASFVLAILFDPIAFPAFGSCADLAMCVDSALRWAADLLAVASPAAGFAFLIYNVILKRVLDEAQVYFGSKG